MKKILLLFIFIAAVFGSIILLGEMSREELDPNNYLAEISAKHERIKSLPSPKIVFIGDSSLPFSLSAQTLEKELGMPVANMGLHAALGLDFILKEVESYAKSGDIIIISMHYYPYAGDKQQGVICHAVDFYPPAATYAASNWLEGQKLKIVCDSKRIKRYLAAKYLKAVTPPGSENNFNYAKDSFNSYGDFKDELYVSSSITFEKIQPMIQHDQGWANSLMYKFLYEMQGKNIKVYYIFPPYPQTLYKKNLQQINNYDKILRFYRGLGVLGAASSSVYSDNMFYNTEYHMTSVGKKENTQRVSDLVKEIIK